MREGGSLMCGVCLWKVGWRAYCALPFNMLTCYILCYILSDLLV